jgi:Kef-type K+ transport system membrane component KefB
MESAADVVSPLLPPLARFAIAMMLIFVIPPLCKAVRLPAVVGYVAAGFLLGPGGLGIVPRNPEVAHFFAEIGKLLLMFFAGLEIDLAVFKRVRHRSMVFGVLTFAIPLLAGTAAGLAFGYPPVGAMVIGSLLASHTLIAYPIVEEAGQLGNEAVVVTIGATVLTDLGALLVLALCIPIHTTGFSAASFAIQLVELAVFVPVIIFGIGWLSRKLFAMVHSQGGQFAAMMVLVALAALGAELIQLEGIIGAFLAGLALNSASRGTQSKQELEFIGDHMFVPVFFMTIGFLIDARVFYATLMSHGGLVVAIVGGLIGSKFLAASAARYWFGYTRIEGLVMWSLSLPQVAATLAAALVARETLNAAGQPLIDQPLIDTIIVLLLVTSVLGPVLTQQLAKRMPPAAAAGP